MSNSRVVAPVRRGNSDPRGRERARPARSVAEERRGRPDRPAVAAPAVAGRTLPPPHPATTNNSSPLSRTNKSSTRACQLRGKARGKWDLGGLLPEAFGLVSVAIQRTPRHPPVRGSTRRRRGDALRRTGRTRHREGKTVSASAPAYLNSLSGKGVQSLALLWLHLSSPPMVHRGLPRSNAS